MKKRIVIFVLCFALILTVGGGALLSAFSVKASAATQYSGPTGDLSKDENFHRSLYPLKVGDKSLSLIQVAEGSQKELYIYVYQPGGTTDLQATSINISKEHKNLNFVNYTLTLVSQEGVFHKYLVVGFTVSSDAERYYEITSIYRAAQEGESQIGDDNGNVISEISYPVKKSFKITNDDVYVEDMDVVTIESKYVGFMRYPVGTFLYDQKDIDVHFVAFTTDKKIENLLEVDVYFKKQSVIDNAITQDSFGEKIPDMARLTANKDLVYKNDGWYSTTFTWKAIETAEDFIASESDKTYTLYEGAIFDSVVRSQMTDTSKGTIKSKDWVIRFACTTYYEDVDMSGIVTGTDYHYTIVSDVSVMRLAFESDGVFYNLGVIDNKQSGDGSPSNTIKVETKLNDDFMDVLSIICLVVVALLLFKVWDFIKPCIVFVIKIVFSPFRVIFGIKSRKK